LGEYIEGQGWLDVEENGEDGPPEPESEPEPELPVKEIEAAILAQFSKHWPHDMLRWLKAEITMHLPKPLHDLLGSEGKFGYMPDFALPKGARQYRVGLPPLTDEHELRIAGYRIVYQFYPSGAVWCVYGAWDKQYVIDYGP
jgi:hypothetical protein